MNVLITGAGGQIGASLLAALTAQGHDVVATDVRLPGDGRGELGRWRVLDVTSRDQVDAVVREVAPEVVFHLAAILSARGERSPALTYDVNQNGTYHVLDACQRHGVSKVLFTSSIAVYGPGL